MSSVRTARSADGSDATVSPHRLARRRSQKSPIAARRIASIIEYLTEEVFRYKCRGLYENDKFLFVLLMALKVDLQRGHIDHEDFQTFVKGNRQLTNLGSNTTSARLFFP